MGSAPLWVTIMLGVLAVVGTVGGAWGGQIIAARRDDRRWEREQQREDLRWSRDRERDRERLNIEHDREGVQRTHDSRIEWRLQRFEVYQQFAASVDAFLPAAWQLIGPWGIREPFNISTFVDENQHSRLVAMRRALIAVEFIAGARVLTVARHLMECADDAFSLKEVVGLVSVNEAGDLRDRVATLHGTFNELRAKFVQEVKVELALEVEQASSPSANP